MASEIQRYDRTYTPGYGNALVPNPNGDVVRAEDALTKITALERERDDWKSRAEKAEGVVQQCSAANFIDEQGVVRKVLGTLPVTKDGCVVGDDCKVFYGGHVVNAELFRSSMPGESDWHPFHPHKSSSTEQARGEGE